MTIIISHLQVIKNDSLQRNPANAAEHQSLATELPTLVISRLVIYHVTYNNNQNKGEVP